MPSPRTRRLLLDHQTLTSRLADWPLIQISGTAGMPPEIYRFTYNLRGLYLAPSGEILERSVHLLEVNLSLGYPRRAPQCRMLTPVFHPNFDESMVCIGDFWAASEGLDDLINAEAKKYFKDADVVCISDNYWLGTNKPCLTYGLRGCNYYSIEVSGPGKDLHSGVFGGTAHEPMTDLIAVMSSLVDPQGKIQIAGLDDLVAPLTDDETALYGDIAFTMDNLYESLGSKAAIHDDKERTLMGRWRYPSLSLHGIEGAFSAPGAKTVIPAKVIGKFSIRTVPNMEIDAVNELVYKHINAKFAELKSKNSHSVSLQHAGKWWVASPKHWNFTAAGKAVERVWGVKPDLTREGGSIPVTLTFEQATGKNVLLLPMGSSTDAAHSINEKLDKRNYIEGIKLLGAYLHYAAEEPMTG